MSLRKTGSEQTQQVREDDDAPREEFTIRATAAQQVPLRDQDRTEIIKGEE